MVFCLVLITLTNSLKDRRLDPFQFNPCVYNIEGIDALGRPLQSDKTDSEEKVAAVMYTSLSTCDMFILPGIERVDTAQHLINHMEEKKVRGFLPFSSSNQTNIYLLSRIDIENIVSLPNVTYPIENSKCSGTVEPGIVRFDSSFHGDVEFHDPVKLTRVFSINMDSSNSHEGCFIREAQAKTICNVISTVSINQDIVVAGTFGADVFNTSESYHNILESCGLKASSNLNNEKKYSRENKKLLENIYIKGDAEKWMDIIVFKQSIKSKFFGQKEITYPMTLYIHQPLTSKWFKFEVTFSTIIMTVSISFFTWLLYYSRIKPINEGGYEVINSQ